MSAFNVTSARNKTGIGGVGLAFVISLLGIAMLILFDGWILSVMWNWFVPNIFTSAPSLSIGEAIGLSLVISAFIYIPFKDEDERLTTILFTPLLRGLMLLAMGAIIHGVMF